eukprot:985176-Prorocentrum_lima.AAC.1
MAGIHQPRFKTRREQLSHLWSHMDPTMRSGMQKWPWNSSPLSSIGHPGFPCKLRRRLQSARRGSEAC